MSALRIAIAGGGLAGRLCALSLARAGHSVTVFDADAGPEGRAAAGWTAAGMLSPVAELESADEDVFALGLRSLALWPGILGSLAHAADETDGDRGAGPGPVRDPVYFRQAGSLMLAHRPDLAAAERVLGLLRSKAPAALHPVPLDATALRELEPAIAMPGHAWLLPDEGQIHTVQAMAALERAASALGVGWRWGCEVVEVSPGELRLRDGQRVGCDHAIDTRGTGARGQLPVRGVRGEIAWLHLPGLALGRPVRLLHPRHRVYLVPRPGDIVVVGASEIESEDRSPISVRSIVELLAAAHSVVPELAEARLVHTETNLRPAMPDNLPFIESLPGLTRINGLFRHGWLIGPALVERALARAALVPAPDGAEPGPARAASVELAR